ncbi:MAG: ribonuclease HII [bacterium]|nr:ribonuclease HII [bacterium]
MSKLNSKPDDPQDRAGLAAGDPNSKLATPSIEYEESVRRQGYRLIAGVDEAGRGPLAGPVVAAAVVLPANPDLPTVNDSKKLTPKQRGLAYQKILEVASDWAIGVVNEGRIDRINILQATYEAMREAIVNLKTSPEFILVDGRAIPGLTIPQRPLVDGDRLSLSIAAASVIAKVIRDQIMMDYDREYPEYGFARHKGYGTKAHREAIAKLGPCKIHRRSFAPIREI